MTIQPLQIDVIKSYQVGLAHSYYDIIIRCNLPPAKAEYLAENLRNMLSYKCIICDDILPHEHSFIEWLAYYTDHPPTGTDNDSA